MILIITFVGTWIHIYSTGYMAHDPGYARYFGYLNLFTGAMLILVLAANLPVMFIGWEGVGLCSFLLIGFWYENDAYAYAGRKAFIVNRIGDFAFLLGMFLLFWAVKSLDFADLDNIAAHGDACRRRDWGPGHAEVWDHERLAAAGGILLFIGACGKSAQLPLFVWLPDAMAGPTPVSALIHAATMVTAGVYMVCRLSFLYTASATAMLVVVDGRPAHRARRGVHRVRADRPEEGPRVLDRVRSSASCSSPRAPARSAAAIFHLMTHAFFKACLFLGAGSVMHGMEHGGSKTPGDIMTMGGLRKHMPITRITFLISCLAISGIFPFSGFFSKDEILVGRLDGASRRAGRSGTARSCGAACSIAALGTAFYMWRLYFLVFGGNERSRRSQARARVAGVDDLGARDPRVLRDGDRLHRRAAPRDAPPHRRARSTRSRRGSTRASRTTWYIDSATQPLIQGEASDATTLALIGAALAVAIIGIVAAWSLYGRGPSKTVDQLVDGPLARRVRGVEAQAVVRRVLRRDDRAAVHRARARPVRDRRSLRRSIRSRSTAPRSWSACSAGSRAGSRTARSSATSPA